MQKKCLVTGAGGFIGSHLTEALLAAGWKVTALVRYNGRGDYGRLEDIASLPDKNLEVIMGDVTDAFQMRRIVKGADVVFHLAALIGIPYSYVAPASYVNANVMGALNMAQAALDAGVKRFVHVSTSEVYGTAQYVPIDEAHPLHAQSPYAASKISADKIIESYVCAFGLPAVTVRPFNTFGPRQSARAVIPTIIAQALSGSKIRLGSLNPVRDITFVSDTVAGLLAAAESDRAVGQTLNLGTGTGVSIGQIAEEVFRILGGDYKIVEDKSRVRPEKSEVLRLISDNAKARELIGWAPVVSLRDGLSRTIDWIKSHIGVYRAKEYLI